VALEHRQSSQHVLKKITVVSILVSNSGGHGFESQPGGQIIVFIVSYAPTGKSQDNTLK
jgi:hypothetical protein